MAKRGEKYECGVCGVEMVCSEGCGCTVSHLICCGKKMKKKPQKKVKKKVKRKSSKSR